MGYFLARSAKAHSLHSPHDSDRRPLLCQEEAQSGVDDQDQPIRYLDDLERGFGRTSATIAMSTPRLIAEQSRHAPVLHTHTPAVPRVLQPRKEASFLDTGTLDASFRPRSEPLLGLCVLGEVSIHHSIHGIGGSSAIPGYCLDELHARGINSAVSRRQRPSLPLITRVPEKVHRARAVIAHASPRHFPLHALALPDRAPSDASESLLDYYAHLSSSPNPTPLDGSSSSADFDEPQTPPTRRPRPISEDIIDLYAALTPGTGEQLLRSAPKSARHQPRIGHQTSTVFVSLSKMPSEVSTAKSGSSPAPLDTPTRPLFDDLPTAYSSITSRSMRKVTKINPASNQTMPLPPAPVFLRERPSHSASADASHHDASQSGEDSHNPRDEISTSTLPAATAHNRSRTKSSQTLGEIAGQNNQMNVVSNTISSTATAALTPHSDITLTSALNPALAPYSFYSERSLTQNSLVPEALHVTKDTSTDVSASISGSSPDRATHEQQHDQSLNAIPSTSSQIVGRLSTLLDHSLKSLNGFRREAQSTMSDILEHYTTRDESSHTLETDEYIDLERASRSVPSIFELSNLAKRRNQKAVAASAASAAQSAQSAQYASSLRHVPNMLEGPLHPVPELPNELPADFDRSFVTSQVATSAQPTSRNGYEKTEDLLNSSPMSVEQGRGELIGDEANNIRWMNQFASSPSSDYGFEQSYFAPSNRNAITNLEGHSIAHLFTSSSDIQHKSHNESSPIGEIAIKHPSLVAADIGMSFTFASSSSDYQMEAVTFPRARPSFQYIANSGNILHSDERQLPVTPTSSRLSRAESSGSQAITVPVPAFNAKEVMSGTQRYSPSRRNPFDDGTSSVYSQELDEEHENEPQLVTQHDQNNELEEGAAGNDAEEWETIPESGRTMASVLDDTMYAHAPNSVSTTDFGEPAVHPARESYQHVYRAQRIPNSDRQMFVPQYLYENGASFPNRNALSTPVSSSNSRGHLSSGPSPPIASRASPTFVAERSTSKGPKTSSEGWKYSTKDTKKSSPLVWQRSSLSVVHERENEGSNEDFSHSLGPHSYLSDFIDPQSSPVANFGSETLVTPASKSSTPLYRARSTASMNDWMMRKLRANDHRMASTPLSYSNSFSKFSRLGPNANITGTPNGTGMREAGSSLAGESSPITLYLPSGSQTGQALSRKGLDHSSASITSPAHTYYISPSTARLQRQRAKTVDTIPEFILRKESFRNRMRAASQGDDYPIDQSAMVQKPPMNLSLFPPELNSPTSLADVREPYDGPSYQTGSSHGMDHFTCQPVQLPMNLPSPHLRQRNVQTRSSFSSDRQMRGEVLSWICLALCVLVPPLLVFYGYGHLDGLMCILSNGELGHFGRKQKRVALWLGYFLTVGSILTIVIIWIVARTVPNNLPR